jgi:hypothetical protein
MAAKVRYEFTLEGAPVVVKSFGGFGVQLNQHVFAKETLDLVPGASKDDLKAKIRTLAPHIVRIFWNNDQEGVPLNRALPRSPENRPGAVAEARWDSFSRPSRLRRRSGRRSTSPGRGSLGKAAEQRTAAVRLANVLEILVKAGATNLRWVTIANEPNTPPHPMTPKMLGLTYIELDKTQKEGSPQADPVYGWRPDRGQQGPLEPLLPVLLVRAHAQRGEHAGPLDAYSVHIYWDYDDTSRFKKRLDDVRMDLNKLANKPGDILRYRLPLYVTEFGTRSKDVDKKAGIDPGNYHDPKTNKKTRRPCESNIAAFQAAWFQIQAARMGCAGLLKWDCHFGKYDKASQQYYVIGPDENGRKGWALQPGYHLLRLFTRTTAPGWEVLQLVPDKVVPGSGTKRLIAFRGAGTNVTVIGLDEGGAHTDLAPATLIHYEIGGLTPRVATSSSSGTRGQGRACLRPDRERDRQRCRRGRRADAGRLRTHLEGAAVRSRRVVVVSSYTVSSSFPVVRRDSRSSCACRASASGYVLPIRTSSEPSASTVHIARAPEQILARGDVVDRVGRVRNVEPAFRRAISTGGTGPLAAP